MEFSFLGDFPLKLKKNFCTGVGDGDVCRRYQHQNHYHCLFLSGAPGTGKTEIIKYTFPSCIVIDATPLLLEDQTSLVDEQIRSFIEKELLKRHFRKEHSPLIVHFENVNEFFHIPPLAPSTMPSTETRIDENIEALGLVNLFAELSINPFVRTILSCPLSKKTLSSLIGHSFFLSVPDFAMPPLLSAERERFLGLPELLKYTGGFSISDLVLFREKMLNCTNTLLPQEIQRQILLSSISTSSRYTSDIVEAVSFDDIRGHKRAKQILQEISLQMTTASSLSLSSLPLSPSTQTTTTQGLKGILLHGPPGTGKTMLARAVASTTKAYFMNVKSTSIIHKEQGASQRSIRSIFMQAKQMEPTIIFMDEFDSIFCFDAQNNSSMMIEHQFRDEMDLLYREDLNVLVLCCTNLIKRIPESLRQYNRFRLELCIE